MVMWDQVKDRQKTYGELVDALAKQFGERLKLVVLYGSQSREEAKSASDHDIFVVAEELPADPLARQREVMTPLLPVLLDLPERLSIVAQTPSELLGNLTPLLIDVCIDGISLYGEMYFAALQKRVTQSLRDAGLQRRRLGGTWMWTFPSLPAKEWEIDWEGYRERI
jgi:predicted nucleotidyltransferase